MAQKPHKKNAPAPKPSPVVAAGALLPEESQRVHSLIEGRHSKAALQLAKDLFKRSASAESEALLLHAYKARIDDLLKLGLSVEAKALLGVVRERFPAAVARLNEQEHEICAVEGRLEDVIRPLGDPNLPAADRDRVETFIRQKVHDLPALAAVSSLPPEHPLRMAANALANAFQAVTQGPVEDALLSLPEVSRRSPLAPWKALVRALASYHRREDAECGKWLLAIANDSLPARLIPSLSAMIGIGKGAKFSPAEQRLIAAAGDQVATLRTALGALEEVLKTGKQGRILDATRTAMAASVHLDAHTRQRLRQHIWVRAMTQDLNPPPVQAALGGPPRLDAYYFRLWGRSLEEERVPQSTGEAAIAWEDFRREAIKENWFAAGGLEDGVLSLHIARLIEKVPPHLLAEMREDLNSVRDALVGLNKDRLAAPGRLYERACQADPSLEAFQAWLNWARKDDAWQVADNVADTWRKARPKDIQPLLYLMESAEKRSAFKKSLKYLEEAEALDRLNPEVRRAKLRLLLSSALRHLHQEKAHLAKAQIEQIESVPEVRPGEVAALAAALRWCCAALDLNPAEQFRQEANLKQSIGDVAAYLLLAALAQAGDMDPMATPPLLQVSRTPAPELLTGAVKACALGQWAGLSIELPRSWNDPLIAAQKQPHGPLDAAQMLALGEVALDSGLEQLAYAVSTPGLAGGTANARFLFLRARSLPRWASQRHDGCYLAALELARRERDTGMAGKILDRLGRALRERPVSPDLLSQILEEELGFKEFPVLGQRWEPKYAEELRSSSQGVDFDPWDDDEEDDFEDDDEDFDQPESVTSKLFLSGLAQILSQLPTSLANQVMSAVAAGEDPVEAMSRILGPKPAPKCPNPAASSPRVKAAPAPHPDQGSLF